MEVHQAPPGPSRKKNRRAGCEHDRSRPPSQQHNSSEDCPDTERTPEDCAFGRHSEAIGLVSLASGDLARPVDARWQIASAIVERRAPRRFFKRVDDDYIDQAVRYLRACRSAASRDPRARDMPYVHQAYLLCESPDKLTRGVLEARLVAGQSIEETAAACSLPVETVRSYEALFFAVVGKLKHRTYIMTAAIGEKCWHGLTESDVDVILKRGGLLKGPLMVDMLVRYYTSAWQIPERLETLTRAELVDLQAMVGIKALILAWVLPSRKIHRAMKLKSLAQELQALIDTVPEHGVNANTIGKLTSFAATKIRWDEVNPMFQKVVIGPPEVVFETVKPAA